MSLRSLATMLFCSVCILGGLRAQNADTPTQGELLLIVGAPGEERFLEGYLKAARIWEELADSAQVSVTRVETETPQGANPREQIKRWIENRDPKTSITQWIVYLGHSTHTPIATKLNLHGPDVSAEELADWLAPLEGPLVFIHGGSSSAPFLVALSQPNRILITATQSGEEQNYARFGEFFANALSSERSDIDLDGQVSLLEAFLTASRSVETFYKEAGRLTTEHAILDDTGDGRGAEATAFQGLRHVDADRSQSLLDGQRARRVAFLPSSDSLALSPEERERRDRLEEELERLKRRKSELDADDYYRELESIFQQLSEVYLPPDPPDS